MLNLNRRDRIADPEDTANTVLKPAIYDPPGSANPGGGASARTTPPPVDLGARTSPLPSATPAKETPESKLFVGVNIKLRGVEITDCDVLVIEGHVEASVQSKLMQIAKPGTLKGTATIDVAEINGEFTGELTARSRLVVQGTGRVSGTIRYGQLIVAEGGEVSGDVKPIDATEKHPVQRASATDARYAPPNPKGPSGD